VRAICVSSFERTRAIRTEPYLCYAGLRDNVNRCADGSRRNIRNPLPECDWHRGRQLSATGDRRTACRMRLAHELHLPSVPTECPVWQRRRHEWRVLIDPRGSSVPLEAVLIGAACLLCCLPLLGGVLAAVGGLVAGFGVAVMGLGPAIAASVGILVAIVIVAGWRWARRTRATCPSCGSQSCAC
jgi:hypothetical protein